MAKKIFFIFFAMGALAGCSKNCPVADASTPPPTAETEEQAVEMLFETMNMQENFDKMTDQILQALAQQQPTLAQHKDVLNDFLRKVLAWENIKPEMVELYVENYTKEELLDMVAFYRTETGRKMSRLEPTISRQSMEISQRLVQKNLPELMGMLLKAAKENGQAPAQIPPPQPPDPGNQKQQKPGAQQPPAPGKI